MPCRVLLKKLQFQLSHRIRHSLQQAQGLMNVAEHDGYSDKTVADLKNTFANFTRDTIEWQRMIDEYLDENPEDNDNS